MTADYALFAQSRAVKNYVVPSKVKCDPGSNKTDLYGRALRAICEQLANGAKHFTGEPGSVTDAKADDGTFG